MSPPYREIENDLLALISSELMDGPIDLTAESKLADAGIDSMSIMRLLLLIEQRFGVWLPEEDLTPRNFETIASLAQAIGRHTPAAVSGEHGG